MVGFDLAGAEQDFPAKHHREAFYIIRNNNVNCTCHAGEGYGPESIHQAVHYCGAQRIGHGTRLRVDPDLMAYVNDHRIPLEICLSSNVETGAVPSLEEHPIKYYLDAGLRVTLNTDNRLMSATNLCNEYALGIRHCGLTLHDLEVIVIFGFKSAFLPLKRKSELLRAAIKESLRMVDQHPEVASRQAQSIDDVAGPRGGLEHMPHTRGQRPQRVERCPFDTDGDRRIDRRTLLELPQHAVGRRVRREGHAQGVQNLRRLDRIVVIEEDEELADARILDARQAVVVHPRIVVADRRIDRLHTRLPFEEPLDVRSSGVRDGDAGSLRRRDVHLELRRLRLGEEREPHHRHRRSRDAAPRTPGGPGPATPAPAPASASGPPPAPGYVSPEEALSRARQLISQARYWDAIQVLESAVPQMEPGRNQHKGRILLAKAYAKNPNWVRRAEETLHDVVREDPENADAHYELGLIYKAGGLPSRAQAMFRRVVELRPDHREAAAELDAPEAAGGGLLRRVFGKGRAG